MKNKFFFLWVGALALISVKCAQTGNLTGGAKDNTPPKITKLSPANLTTNFSNNTIAMEFDEYVEIKNLNAELVVSPPLDYPLTYKIKGKRVIFEIQDTLIPNTTYNLNFGKAIVDLNEGNVLDSNLYVFSTGAHIDSGLIEGTVSDAFTQEAMKDIKVVLYTTLNDSGLFKGNPMYVTETDNQGKYQLRFLAEGNYNIYALETPGEKFKYVPQTHIGFLDENVTPTRDEIDMFLFREKDTLQFISKFLSKDFFSFSIGFNNDLKKPEFQFSPSQKKLDYYIEELEADSFKFWIPKGKDVDSITVYISDETGYTDTAEIDIYSKEKFYKLLKKKKRNISSVKIGLSASAGVHHYFDTLKLNFSRPLANWNIDSMKFVSGTDTIPMSEAFSKNIVQAKLPNKKEGTTDELRNILITHQWKPSREYAFIFDNGSFTDILNLSNDSTTLKFKTKNFEDYGSFRFTVKVDQYQGPLLLELLNTKGKKLRTYNIKSGDVIYHELAVPGTYKFRLIFDANDNKIWDTGNIEKGIQPEKIVNYKGTIDIRANWDMEETWEVEFNQ